MCVILCVEEPHRENPVPVTHGCVAAGYTERELDWCQGVCVTSQPTGAGEKVCLGKKEGEFYLPLP